MFESGYPFKLRTKSLVIDEHPLLRKIVYHFRTRKNRRYLVHIHEYEYKVFVIKFHDVRHRHLPNRFNLVINDFDCSKILRTVIEIATEIFRSENCASFAFIGVEKEREIKNHPNSQRHRIYKSIAENFLGVDTFLHGYEYKTNCYLLVNKRNEDPEATYRAIIEMFSNEFEELSHL